MKANHEIKVCTAALRLAASEGWAAVTLPGIARTAKISEKELGKYYSDKNAILPAIVRYIDDRTEAKAGKPDAHAKPQDRLFEVMMTRFDALQSHREGLLAIIKHMRQDPALARLILPAHVQSMQKMLKLARLNLSGVQNPVAAFGLLAVYYRALWRWQSDSTKDMAKTMAALDQGLRYANKAAEILFRN